MFDNEADMYEMESRIVDSEFVRRQDNYNGITGGMTGRHFPGELHPMYGKSHSEDTKRKMSAAKKGDKHHNWGKTGEGMPMFAKNHSEESKNKIRAAMIGNKHGKGFKWSDDAKARMSEARKGSDTSHLVRCGEDNGFFGKSHSEETKTKIRESYNKSQILLTCPHCEKQSRNKANMRRYHFDNCKSINNVNILEV